MLAIIAGMDQTDSYVARFWPTWCSWSRLQQTVDFPQLQSIKVVDISFVVQRLILMVIDTIEIPQWRVDLVVDAPFYAGRTDSHLYGIRCLPEEYKMWIFWEKTSVIISVFNTLWFNSGYMFGVSLRGFLGVSPGVIQRQIPMV